MILIFFFAFDEMPSDHKDNITPNIISSKRHSIEHTQFRKCNCILSLNNILNDKYLYMRLPLFYSVKKFLRKTGFPISEGSSEEQSSRITSPL